MIVLRFASPDDAPALAELIGSLVTTTAINFKSTGPTAAQLAVRLEAELPIYPWIVAMAGGRLAGFAMARVWGGSEGEQWSVETGLTLAAEARGAGLGTRIYAAVLEVLAAQGYHNAFAGITLPNPASERLHVKLGFRRFGLIEKAGWKLDRWHDTSWWQKHLVPAATRPAPIIAPVAVEAALQTRLFGGS